MGKYMFDSIVIGGGAAGLTAAGISANFGAKTMMIEQDRLGGDCTWTGCVPSKTLIKAASVMHNAKEAKKYGLTANDVKFDVSKVMEHVDRIRREVYEDADDPAIFEEMGIEVVHGRAEFLDDHTIKITDGNGLDREVTGKYFFICTGAKAFVPPIVGVEDVDVLTNESLFEIDNLPEKLIIIGGGPIGTEMAQSFVRLGTAVDVIDMASGILTNDDPELTSMLKEELEEEGVIYHLNSGVKEVKKSDSGVEVVIEKDGVKSTVAGSKVLFATGRRANIDTLNLDAAGVNFDKNGVTVNDKCRTNKRHI